MIDLIQPILVCVHLKGIKFIVLINQIDMQRQSLVQKQNSIPIPEASRNSTDVFCTFLSAAFALALFIIACISYNSVGLNKAYFTFDVQNSTDTPYVSSADYYGFQTTFWCTVLVALGLGILWMTWVHFSPRLAPHAAFVLAVLSLIALGVITLVSGSNFFNKNGGWKIGVVVTCFVLAVILFSMFWFYSTSVRIQGIFLEYARHFLHEVRGTFAYLFIFLIALTGFIALITFQHVAFSSKSNSNNNFWDFTNPGALGILNILEFIWGLQFLRDAFNFCVSGAATNWYWNQNNSWYFPLQRLLTRHWGSVAGGSFLNAFLQIPTLLVELFTCHKETCCANAGTFCENKCTCWGYFFNIVRTDTYGYINLSGQAFCNSGRECYNNCQSSRLFVGGYNVLKHYRFAATIFLVSLTYLLGLIFANLRVTRFTLWHNIILVVIAYAVVTWFVDIDADAAQGISTSFLAENNKAQGFQNMQNAIPYFKNQLSFRGTRDNSIADGRC